MNRDNDSPRRILEALFEEGVETPEMFGSPAFLEGWLCASLSAWERLQVETGTDGREWFRAWSEELQRRTQDPSLTFATLNDDVSARFRDVVGGMRAVKNDTLRRLPDTPVRIRDEAALLLWLRELQQDVDDGTRLTALEAGLR